MRKNTFLVFLSFHNINYLEIVKNPKKIFNQILIFIFYKSLIKSLMLYEDLRRSPNQWDLYRWEHIHRSPNQWVLDRWEYIYWSPNQWVLYGENTNQWVLYRCKYEPVGSLQVWIWTSGSSTGVNMNQWDLYGCEYEPVGPLQVRIWTSWSSTGENPLISALPLLHEAINHSLFSIL